MQHDNDSDAWLTLATANGSGNARIRQLLQVCGSAAALLDASDAWLSANGARDSDIKALRDARHVDTSAAARWLDHDQHRLIHCLHHDYPPRLADIPDPPLALFVDGDPDLLQMPALAMVGSRNPTRGGIDTASSFARFLAARGLAIVSGLASGIDAAAHTGALDANGATVAVLGTGIDQYYPTRNRALHQRIRSEGVVVSEYPPGRPALPGQFPARNRIISGLALGTLVVEATRRSGSLITARLAGEQGRSVFAIPGSIHNPLARGCHQLIRQGALLVEDADDIFSELGLALSQARRSADGASAPAAPEIAARTLDADYQQVLDALGWDPANMDQLVERTGLTTAELSSMLLIMELDGLVQTIPGGGFMRCKQRKV